LSLKYLLDTNILSQIVKEPFGRVASTAMSRGSDRICTSIVVAGELWHGVENSGSERLRATVTATLADLPVLDLRAPAEFVYASIRTTLQRQGVLIGANDLWIAAHAMAEGLTLVTNDVTDFSRVEGLAIENWLR
jgi:tRNA(fMet)-specific endonuclease VapC